MSTKMSQEDRIVKSRIKMLMEYPFFGYLSNFLKLVETKQVPTGATDGSKYYFNPDFIDKLTDEEVNFLTAHETLHPALGHLWRGIGKDKLIFNHAADFVINGMIRECDPNQRVFKMIKGGLYDEKFKGMSTEEVYDILINDEDYVKNARMMALQGNGGTIDSHDAWGTSNSEEEGESGGKEEDWQGRVVQATQQSDGTQKGKIPSLLRRLFSDLTTPQKNWRQLLAEFVEQEIVDYGFAPPDKRFSHTEVILPDFSEPEDIVKNLVFAVDTSGSITEEYFTVFISEIIGCLNQFGGKVKGTLIYCDSKIADNGVYDLEDAHKSLPVGGGGTDFRPVFKWIEDNMEQCAGLVYLTDGEGDFPMSKPYYPTLWVLTQKYQVPFGITTEIKV